MGGSALSWLGEAVLEFASNSLTSACLLLVIRTAFHFADMESLGLTCLSPAL